MPDDSRTRQLPCIARGQQNNGACCGVLFCNIVPLHRLFMHKSNSGLRFTFGNSNNPNRGLFILHS